MNPAWRVSVDQQRCIGTGICAGAAPDHFVLIDGVSIPLAEVISPEEEVLDAADSCPMGAITVRDAVDDTLISPEP